MADDTPRNDKSDLTRRDFLRTAAAGTGGAVLAGCLGWCGAGCTAETVHLAPAKPGIKPPPGEGPWRALFDGKKLDGWMKADGKPPGKGWVVEDGAIVRKAGAGDVWTRERFGDFALDLEMKTKGNSGIFIRTDNVRDCVQTGIEVAVDNSYGKKQLGRHDFGAIYDCLAPVKNALTGPDEWQRVVITCRDNKITVQINGELVTDMDLDRWTEPRKNPDGSGNKFGTALKKFKREGHIGLQDHGAWVAYRKLRIKPLNQTPKKPGGPTCPVCGRKGKEGEFCAKCGAVITALGEFKCTRCGKKVKSGTYCAKHNRFRFNVNDDVNCPKCGKPKGVWCAGCGKYACLPAVTYCAKCQKPFDRIRHNSTCPKCGTKVEPKKKAPAG
jgi:hypothetical protein